MGGPEAARGRTGDAREREEKEQWAVQLRSSICVEEGGGRRAARE